MSSQIFRKDVPPQLLYDLLDQISLKTNKYYVVDMNAYRKLLFHNYHEPFLNTLLEYYHLSKQYYVTRKLTYNSFINIVRHICKNGNIMYTSQMIYNKSKYNIDYHIYYKTAIA
jgi:hypothetical protein